ncbi:MAG: hypothetical protein ACPGWR_04015 [Ardenticatenaceae bacterium]
MRTIITKLSAILLMALVAALVGMSQVSVTHAQSAKNASWAVSVTYQNVGNAPAAVGMNFYPELNGTPISFNPLGDGATLAAGAGESFFIGRVSGINAGFRGSAVMSADQPMVATVVQFSQDSGMKMRLLSNGFQASDGSEQYLIATTLLDTFGRTTVFSVQNTESVAIDATIKFIDASNGSQAASVTHTIPAQSSKYIDLSNPADTGLPASTTSFNGSAVISAVQQGTTNAAKVVAAASEYYLNRPLASNFEGVPLSQASNTIYMGSAVCERFGIDTFYAVQNASLTDSASITVEYRETNGTVKTSDGPYDIGPGQKKSIRTCNPSSGVSMNNFTGSATITSTGGAIVAIGKAQSSLNAPSGSVGPDVVTAFLGQPSGASKLALPFVRWAPDNEYNGASNVGGRQRSFIAVQNLEATEIKVNVTYSDKDGVTQGSETLTIPAFAKQNSHASRANALGSDGQFGYYGTPINAFGGGATVEAHTDNPTAKFLAVVRVQHPGAGEDYNGMPID